MTNCKLYNEGKGCPFKWTEKQQKKKDPTRQTGLLQGCVSTLLHVETGNVLTDMQSTVWTKHVEPKEGSVAKHWKVQCLIMSDHSKQLYAFLAASK